MAVRKFMKTSGIAALAVSMAMAALPSAASAQERGRWGAAAEAQSDQNGVDSGSFRQRWNGGGEARQRGDGGNGGERGGWQQRQQSAPQVQAQAAPQVQARIGTPEQRSWSGGDRGNWRSRGGDNTGATATWNGGGNRGSWQQRTESAPVPQAQPVPQQQTRSWSGNRTSGEWAGRTEQTTRDGNRDRRTNDWRDSWRGDDNRRADNWRDNRNDRYRNDSWRGDNRTRYSDNYRAWNRDWRRDNRYNWSSWRNHNRNVFRMGTYYSPYRNWSYRRLSIGFYLDSLFYSSNYWINDPWQYRLPDVYGPYRWVRYYDDALLVDIYSGQVVDVIYDFFW